MNHILCFTVQNLFIQPQQGPDKEALSYFTVQLGKKNGKVIVDFRIFTEQVVNMLTDIIASLNSQHDAKWNK